MKRILSVVILLVLSSSVHADNPRDQEIMKKCAGLDHWSMLRCVELENRGENGWPAPTGMTEPYRSLADLAKTINPVPANKKSIEHGKAIFYHYCFACHGIEGKGNGPLAKYVGRQLVDLTAVNVRNEKDGVLFWQITEGDQPRPMVEYRPFLNNEDVWDTINYIRSLSSVDPMRPNL